MKSSQKGFVVPLIIVIALLAIGGGTYVYVKNKPVNKVDQKTEKAEPTPNIVVFGSDDSIKNGQVLTPQQKVVKQIVTKATSTAITVTTVKNCMNDFQCIIDAAKTCTPAKADVTTTVDIGKMFAFLASDPSKVPSVMQTQTSHYEIRGLINGMCVYYSKLTDIKNPNLPPEGVESLLSQAGDMTCSYSTTDLVARLKNMQEETGSFSFNSSDTPAQRNAKQCREFGVSSNSN
ncbi:MAG: hypothetical protein WC666_01545 [Candidatus Paceibacterota bacterium]|jgi:hypothetical protein